MCVFSGIICYIFFLIFHIFFHLGIYTHRRQFHGQGIGSHIIDTLESDELFLRAERIEIPSSIAAVEFYRKNGYEYKNGIKELDDEQHYRLKKFRNIHNSKQREDDNDD
ncbi:MAG: GNAT family N-acetyltransferase [Lachnospiraceae bacterium]|nr:GNAT family N-acetyltransferase [Lachnospiraceae bacterium]